MVKPETVQIPIFRLSWLPALAVLFFLIMIPGAGNGQDLQGRLDSIVGKYDSLGGFNGLIILANSPEDVATFAYGFANPNTQDQPLHPGDRFYLASLAKNLTGMAILRLIDQDSISPDDAIGPRFPGLHPALQKITVRQLANHRNAIHDFHTLPGYHDSLRNGEILEMLSRLDSTVFEPGSAWGYTNSGYVLLALLVERVAGGPFREYLSRHILHALGMKDHCFNPCSGELLYGYAADGTRFTKQPVYAGPSGIFASGHDIIAFYKAVEGGDPIWKKYFEMAFKWSDPSKTPGWNYGFGWYFHADEMGKFRAHSGRNDGFLNYIRWYEDLPAMFCILSNKQDDQFMKQLREEVADLFRETLNDETGGRRSETAPKGSLRGR